MLDFIATYSHFKDQIVSFRAVARAWPYINTILSLIIAIN